MCELNLDNLQHLKIRKIVDGVYAGAQIYKNNITELKQAGVKTIICNRPDNEDADQPLYAEIEQEALKQGLRIINIPVSNINQESVDDMGKALASSPKPIYAYCRSGVRVTKLCSIIYHL